jgi:GSCFA family
VNFRTELDIKPSQWSFGLADGVLTIGSCFADAMGNKLHESKFNVLTNPFGTVYNPLSIHKLLSMAINQEAPDVTGYCQRDDLFLHHNFHSTFASETKEGLAALLNAQLKLVHQTLKLARVVIITYGTAWVYEQQSTKQVVANCHKLPQQQFSKLLITQKRILESFEKLETLLREFNPAMQIILTLSPVRHIKDSLELNSVSKATLRLSCHTLAENYSNVSYFPAYEFMLDELRDYRFYEPDLIHLTKAATDYIWEKFCGTYLSDEAKIFLTRWNKIKVGLQHTAFNPASESHKRFLNKLLAELKAVDSVIPVKAEIAQIESQLKN